MNHMKPEDLQSFIERLDILKRWALSERAQLHDGRAEHAPDAQASEPCPSSAGEVGNVTAFAAVKVRRPTLQDIEQALQRISLGLYALCLDCERVIARERMLIEPAAIRCHACQFRLAR
ncbi:TraR/DksA C4-type zinc finger protein [Variovorax sp. LjRoot290]|uniref:TraR/DksA family transcriptional regulator n=1 Tax=unclassified Variovorax TaxID=663243 RepID=UPI000889D025|nr:TraR/DksA C4-type zinc finger protein [Variovorax sp. CF079]SDE54034.1 RNA polymerase-binding transcription factor DksA [Variovorax sp. CF079]